MNHILDTTTFSLVQTPDGYWRHCDPDQRLLTTGWATREAAEWNARFYLDTAQSRLTMRDRFVTTSLHFKFGE